MASGSGCRDCGRAFPGMDFYELCAACVGKRLAERVGDVVKELLPAGKYERGGREYRVGSTAGESGRSLVIEIGGPKSGVWYDHSAGEGGDLLDLIARCIGGGAGEALRWARQWLGQPARQRPVRPMPVPAPRDEADTRERAAEIWREGGATHRGDFVCRYCLGREIDLEGLARANDGKLPPTLRCHPRLWNNEAGRHYPAMVAAIRGREDQLLAVHRTWLIEREDGSVTKAPVEEPKKTLGSYRLAGGAGCIRLWRPKWREATNQDVLALSEGIEDALTFTQAALREPKSFAKLLANSAEEEAPLLRVAAGVSLSALMSTWVPKVIPRIVLVAQNDRPGSPAADLFDRVRQRFRREGREVWLFRPPPEVKDVNEVAMRLSRR